MLVDGIWSESDKIIENGRYLRQTSVHDMAIGTDIIQSISEQPGRFHLVASWSCPWSHRTMLIRVLKGLTNYLPLHITGGTRAEGYPSNYGKAWLVPGTVLSIIHLHQLYTLNNPNHTGRATLPILWDSKEHKIISDESSMIMRAFDLVKAESPTSSIDFTFYPDDFKLEIDSVNEQIYNSLSNGVYQAGFAQSQKAYRDAVDKVFWMLDELEKKLVNNRYLLGSLVTESDWRLFATLVRFDIDYFMHSKCCRRRLIEYPNLWAYVRELYSWNGIPQTINLEAIHQSNYLEKKIVAVKPEINWTEPHGRETLGQTHVSLRNGEIIALDIDCLKKVLF